MNIKDSYLHGADGKGVVKWLYLASSAETVYKPSDGTTYTTASGKDLIFLLADISGTKFGITLPQAPAYSQGVLTKSRSTNASHYLVFVDSDNSSATNELLYTDAEIIYNPSTNLLSVPNLIVSGAGGFNYSGIAAATENAATCIWFSDLTNAGTPVTSNNFKYNPSTDTLTVGNITGQYITIGNTQVALKGTYTPDTSITNSSTHNTIPSSKAVWDLITNIDAFVYKGTLNGGSLTTYTPAANCGYVYKVATAGLINGIYCEVGDLFICNTDSTAAATSSNVGTVSTKWDIIQANATMADYLLRAGGTMLGQLKWNDTNALPEDATPSYLVTVSGIPASGSAAITKYTSVTKFKLNVVSNFVVGTQTAATNLWTGALPSGVTAYYDGLSIDYYLPYAGTGTAATLQLGNLGAVQVYNGRGPGNTTTHIPANSIVRMTYYNGKWYINSYYNSDTTNTTGGDDTSSKIFIVGMTSQTTNNGNQRTYTHDTCYIGTDGCLYSGGAKVLTALPSSAVTGSGTNGYITRWTGEHTIGNLVALSAEVSSLTQSTKFLREDGTWAVPSYTTNTNTWRNVRINAETSDKLGTGTSTGPLIIKSGTGITVSWDSTNKAVVITNSAPDVNHNTDRTGLKKGTAGSTTASGLVIANSATGLIMEGGTHKFKVGDGTNSFEIPIAVTNLSLSSITSLSTFTHTSDLIYAAAGGGNSVADKPTNTDSFGVISFKTAAEYYGQILMEAGGTMYRRSGLTLSGGWKKIADSSNVVNDNISVTWNTETTIATIAGVPIKIKIPANPNSNTWRNIYTGGTSRVDTGTSTKAMNFTATGNLSISYLAAGTDSGQSGSADYFTIRVNAAANAKATAGYVAAPTANTDYNVWMTDNALNPAWRAVTASNPTLAWDTTSTIGTIGGVTFQVTMPSNPNSNTWRNIYVAGTLKMTTATSSKALNFKAGSNVTLSYLAPGTTGGTTDSGSADYGTLTITANIPSNNVTGSGTNGYITKWTGTNTIGNLVAIGSGTTKFLREDGTWATPAYIANTDRTGIKLGTVSGTAKTDATVIIAGSTTGLTIQGGTNSFKIGDGTNYINVSVGHGLSTKNMTINETAYALYTSASSLPTFIAPTSLGSANQILATNSSANGLTWVNKPTSNVTTTAVVGSSATATSQITAAQSNPYYNLLEGGAVTRSIRFIAGTGITISAATDGLITIINSKPDVNHNTDYRVRLANSTSAKWRSILLGYTEYDAWNTAVGDTIDNLSYITNSIRFQPSTGTLSSTKLGINGLNDSHNLYVNGSSLLAGTLTTYTSGTSSYDQGIRINRTATNQWATLLIGKSGTSTSGTGTSTAGDGAWLIGTPASKNSLVVCLNGSSESSCLCLAGSGNNDMKWNDKIVAHAGNISNKDATIGTSSTTIATIAGVNITAKIGSYASSSHNHGTSKTAWGQTYVNANGALLTIKGTITSDYFVILDSSTNPYLKLVHTYSSTSYTYYVQGYQGKLLLGNTSAKSVLIDSTGRTTINYDGSAAELLTLTGGSSCTYNCIRYSALTNGYSWSVGINKDHYYVWNSNLSGKAIAVNNDGSFEINSNLTGAIAHIKFTRASYNYILVPTDGTLAVCVNSVSGVGAKLAVNTSSVFPGTTNAITLGTTSLRWSTIYAQTSIMVGNTSYTTSTSNVSGTTIVPGCITVCATAAGVAYTLYDKKVLVGSLQISPLGTATVDNGGSTHTSAIGECKLVLGNNKVGKTNDTGSVLGNARGSILIFGSGSTGTTLYSNPNGNRDVYLPYYAGTMYLVHTGSATATVGGSTTPVYVAANGRLTAGSAYYSTTQADGRFHPLNGKITRTGGSYSWYNILQYNSSNANPSYYTADCAIINITSYTGWLPWIRAVDNEKGSWAIGQHANALYIGRIPKSNTSNDLTYKWTFGATGNLTMTGSCYAAHFYENSDIRLKKIIKGSEYSVYDYAKIPIINFYWLNKTKNLDLHIGSIAQSVEDIIPEVVISGEYKSIDYGVLGTIASITACKKLVEHDIEIYNLKEKLEAVNNIVEEQQEEIKILRNKIKEMEELYG